MGGITVTLKTIDFIDNQAEQDLSKDTFAPSPRMLKPDGNCWEPGQIIAFCPLVAPVPSAPLYEEGQAGHEKVR